MFKNYGFSRFLTHAFLLMFLLVCLAVVPSFGQSLTQGAISGTLFDPSHAVITNATVNLKSLDTGATETTTTGSTGAYHFSLLKPGNYQITVKQPGFAEIQLTTVV